MRESFRKSAIELGSGGRLTEIETKTDTDTLMRTPKCTYTLSRDTRELRTMRYLVRGYTRAMHTHRREPENLTFLPPLSPVQIEIRGKGGCVGRGG